MFFFAPRIGRRSARWKKSRRGCRTPVPPFDHLSGLPALPAGSRVHHSERTTGLIKSIALLTARLIFAAVFLMACGFKFAGMDTTAGYIAAAGFPAPLFLAWLAALFELGLGFAFLTGAFFREAAAGRSGLCPLSGLRLSRPGALGDEPGRVRLLCRSLQLLRRAALRRRPRPGPGRPALERRWTDAAHRLRQRYAAGSRTVTAAAAVRSTPPSR